MKRKFRMEGELEVVGSHAIWRNCLWDVHERMAGRNLVPSDIG